MHNSNTATEHGFTLLEVMVALTIFATLSIALFAALQHVALNSVSLSERTQALWIADNRMNELRAGIRTIAPRPAQERVAFGGREWWLFSDAQIVDDDLLQVQLKVSAESKLQRARNYSRAELIGYIEIHP